MECLQFLGLHEFFIQQLFSLSVHENILLNALPALLQPKVAALHHKRLPVLQLLANHHLLLFKVVEKFLKEHQIHLVWGPFKKYVTIKMNIFDPPSLPCHHLSLFHHNL